MPIGKSRLRFASACSFLSFSFSCELVLFKVVTRVFKEDSVDLMVRQVSTALSRICCLEALSEVAISGKCTFKSSKATFNSFLLCLSIWLCTSLASPSCIFRLRSFRFLIADWEVRCCSNNFFFSCDSVLLGVFVCWVKGVRTIFTFCFSKDRDLSVCFTICRFTFRLIENFASESVLCRWPLTVGRFLSKLWVWFLLLVVIILLLPPCFKVFSFLELWFL